MRMTMLVFYIDPGHGWLRVPNELIIELGLVGHISSYSYHRGEYSYLEEDCDASNFLDAIKLSGIPYKIKQSYSNKSSRIRNYNRYHSSLLEKY